MGISPKAQVFMMKRSEGLSFPIYRQKGQMLKDQTGHQLSTSKVEHVSRLGDE